MNTDILGKGIAYPLQINPRGGVKESSYHQKVRESIQIILGTEPGERVMRPGFGCKLGSLVFAPNNSGTANLARHYVEDALTTWEPRIDLQEVSVQNDHENACLLIHVCYQLRSTREPQDLVYPFYLEQPV